MSSQTYLDFHIFHNGALVTFNSQVLLHSDGKHPSMITILGTKFWHTNGNTYKDNLDGSKKKRVF